MYSITPISLIILASHALLAFSSALPDFSALPASQITLTTSGILSQPTTAQAPTGRRFAYASISSRFPTPIPYKSYSAFLTHEIATANNGIALFGRDTPITDDRYYSESSLDPTVFSFIEFSARQGRLTWGVLADALTDMDSPRGAWFQFMTADRRAVGNYRIEVWDKLADGTEVQVTSGVIAGLEKGMQGLLPLNPNGTVVL